MHIYLSAGSTASHSVPALLDKQQSTANRYGVRILQSYSPFNLKVFVFFIVSSLLVCVSSFTDTDPLCYPALFAHHVAAPVKLAVAAFAPSLLQDVVASPTAKTLTVVHARAGLVADPALRARRVRPQVALAEIRRLFKVDQFVDAWPPPMRVVVVVVVVVLMMVMVVVVVVVVMVVVVVVVVVVGVVELSGVSVVGLDKRGDVEALFEDGAHHPELRGDLPAGLQLAAPRRPVALAFPSHVVEHHLRETQMERDKKREWVGVRK